MYAIRLPANQVLQEQIEHLLTRPVGRPPRKPVVWFADFKYQAASWDRPRRVIGKVEWHGGELFPRVGFIVTNRSARAQGVVHFYNGRGAKVVHHSRIVTFQMAEVAVSKEVWAEILSRINRLRWMTA